MSDELTEHPVNSYFVAIGAAIVGWIALVGLLMLVTFVGEDTAPVRRSLYAAGVVGVGLVVILAPLINVIGTRGRHGYRTAAVRGMWAMLMTALLVLSALTSKS